MLSVEVNARSIFIYFVFADVYAWIKRYVISRSNIEETNKTYAVLVLNVIVSIVCLFLLASM